MPSRPIRVLWIAALVSMMVLADAAPADADSIQREIAGLEKAANDAYAANDLDKYFAYYADDLDAIFYDSRTTLSEYRKSWTASVKAGNPVVSVKLADLKVQVSPGRDVAIASYQIDVRNRHSDGRTTDEHAYETDVWLKRGATWKIVHAQYSIATPPPQ